MDDGTPQNLVWQLPAGLLFVTLVLKIVFDFLKSWRSERGDQHEAPAVDPLATGAPLWFTHDKLDSVLNRLAASMDTQTKLLGEILADNRELHKEIRNHAQVAQRTARTRKR